MKRRETQPMTKHTLNLFAGHFERLQTLYPRVGAAFVIRRLVEQHLADKEQIAEATVPAPELNLTVEDIL
jgi:hypothetical protein